MKHSPSVDNRVRSTVQSLFLVFFLIGIAQSQGQRWLPIFAIGAVLTVFVGRLYCSWVCPMNTLFQPIAWLESKVKPWRRPAPRQLRKSWLLVPTLALIVFASRVSGGVLSPLTVAVLLAVTAALVFEESFWHRYLCPYGALLSLPGRFAQRSYQVECDACIGCGLCEKSCPTTTIAVDDHGKRTIDPTYCLQCSRCHSVCPTAAITHTRLPAQTRFS